MIESIGNAHIKTYLTRLQSLCTGKYYAAISKRKRLQLFYLYNLVTTLMFYKSFSYYSQICNNTEHIHT